MVAWFLFAVWPLAFAVLVSVHGRLDQNGNEQYMPNTMQLGWSLVLPVVEIWPMQKKLIGLLWVVCSWEMLHQSPQQHWNYMKLKLLYGCCKPVFLHMISPSASPMTSSNVEFWSSSSLQSSVKPQVVVPRQWTNQTRFSRWFKPDCHQL